MSVSSCDLCLAGPQSFEVQWRKRFHTMYSWCPGSWPLRHSPKHQLSSHPNSAGRNFPFWTNVVTEDPSQDKWLPLFFCSFDDQPNHSSKLSSYFIIAKYHNIMFYQSLFSGEKWSNVRKWSQAVQGDVYIGHCEELLHREGGQAMEWASQGCGRISISGGI